MIEKISLYYTLVTTLVFCRFQLLPFILLKSALWCGSLSMPVVMDASSAGVLPNSVLINCA
jgi:hypothetical protein